MKIKLISHTQNALELLLGTKSARMRGQDPSTMTEEEKRDHWAYMLDTIKSPFEFVDYIFEIEGVSKNFTHQLVRTRTGAYQQETSRALEIDVMSATVMPEAFIRTDDPDGEPTALGMLWMDAMADADAHYKGLLAAGAELQDARAVCPSNMVTKIQAKFNLRTLSDMAKNRLCARTQGEYQDAFRIIRELVLEQHPWTDSLLQVACVSTGQCAFPRWGGKVVGVREIHPVQPIYQCPFFRSWMDLSKEKEELRKVFWSSAKAEANPIAHNGKSM